MATEIENYKAGLSFKRIWDKILRYGRDLLDLTTRQQVQLRWIRIEDVPEVLNRLEAADIYLGAEHGLAGGFNERWKTGVPFSEIGPLLADVVRDFIRENEGAESFRAWCIRTGKIKGDLHDFAPMLKEG